MSTCLFIIDPQIDFVDERNGSMPVKGGAIDMMNLTDVLHLYGNHLDNVVVTLDQHQFNHIAHPEMWLDHRDHNPKPYTRIAYCDIEAGRWRASLPENQEVQANYVRDAETTGVNLTTRPRHCIIGSRGAMIFPQLSSDLHNWVSLKRRVHFFKKSSNWTTEHFSSFKTAVTRYDDATTWFNNDLYKAIQADTILIGGADLSSVEATIMDALEFSGEDNLAARMVVLDDCTSPRGGFNTQAEKFLHNFCERGGRVSRSDAMFRYTLDC